MRKLWLLFFVVVLALGVVGCSKGDKDADPVGTWVMTYDWDCNGSAETVVWHLYNNKTFISSSGSNGSWSVSKKDITINYANGTIYNGIVNGDSMSGTSRGISGSTGCWSAQRTSTSP